jgi:NAD(P)-dependent dehydrogenase (short-subunit alcohol dehydrogenase family)
MAQAFVTGGSGFIGRALARRLVTQSDGLNAVRDWLAGDGKHQGQTTFSPERPVVLLPGHWSLAPRLLKHFLDKIG